MVTVRRRVIDELEEGKQIDADLAAAAVKISRLLCRLPVNEPPWTRSEMKSILSQMFPAKLLHNN